MNFYQKITCFITVLVIGITVAIVSLGGISLNQDNLIRIVPVIIAEIICGVFIIVGQRDNSPTLPVFIHSAQDLCYLLFVIIMAFIPAKIISQNVFILIQLVVFVLFYVVAKLVFTTAIKHAHDQKFSDGSIVAARRNLFNEMNMVCETVKLKFAGNQEIIKKCLKLCDDFRFAGNAFCEHESILLEQIAQLQSSAESYDENTANELIDKILIRVKCCQDKTLV